MPITSQTRRAAANAALPPGRNIEDLPAGAQIGGFAETFGHDDQRYADFAVVRRRPRLLLALLYRAEVRRLRLGGHPRLLASPTFPCRTLQRSAGSDNSRCANWPAMVRADGLAVARVAPVRTCPSGVCMLLFDAFAIAVGTSRGG